MPDLYVAEQQTARWTSDAVHQSFLELGFELKEWPVTQHLEKEVPSDSIFYSAEFSKLFGLQYKTLYHNGEDSWPLTATQHDTIRKYPWMYYCCSEIRDVNEAGLALHLSRFYRTSFEFQAYLPRRIFAPDSQFFSRWGAFYRALRDCPAGVKIASAEQLRDLIGTIEGDARMREVRQLSEYLLADFDRRLVFSRRNFLTQ